MAEKEHTVNVAGERAVTPIDIEGPTLGKADACEPILRSLPGWFAIERAIVQYVKDIEVMPTVLARADGRVVGFLTIKRHNEYSAEVHVLAIRAENHRTGIGKRLLERAEEFLNREGIEYLQVKTLAPSRPVEEYARTRSFYMAMGFRPLEEFEELWDKENPCLMMIKKL